MSYEEKYLKYKQKYLNLKNQIGGLLVRNSSTDPGFAIPMESVDVDYAVNTNIETKMSELLSQNPDIFILKVGSNDINGQARCDNDRCTYYIYDLKFNNNIFNDNSDIKELPKNFSTLYKKLDLKEKQNIIVLQVDPLDKTFIPFIKLDQEIILKNINVRNVLSGIVSLNDPNLKYHHIRSTFPLSRGKITDGELDLNFVQNKIIKLLIDYPGKLILFNAVASQCFGIFKFILDYRNLLNKTTIYSGVAQNSIDSDCEIQKYKLTINAENKITNFDLSY